MGGPDRRPMDATMVETLGNVDEFAHEYDYGTTSRQTIRRNKAGRGAQAPTHPDFAATGIDARNQPPKSEQAGTTASARVI